MSETRRHALGFWAKLNEDWVFNFSGMLAYNFLTATAPLALVILAIAGLALGALSPATLASYQQGIASHLPAGAASLTHGALVALNKSAGALLVIAIVSAFYAGSRLFVALENCFSVIYRVDSRGFVPQNLMAIGMTALYAVLAPVTYLVSALFSGAFNILKSAGGAAGSPSPVQAVIGYLGGVIVSVFGAFIIFLAVYLFTPNRDHPWRHALKVSWRGALVAAALLTLYQQIFPLYQRFFLRNAGYGSVVGLAIIAIVFLYYVGFITLLGAEINAWSEGLRPLRATLPDLYRQRDGASLMR
ncbi:MAG TPA: YhjD/YihY/BrkB family envelope integrity protein [Ktedonobacterales bacterium]